MCVWDEQDKPLVLMQDETTFFQKQPIVRENLHEPNPLPGSFSPSFSLAARFPLEAA